jgi:hypothetical protein
MITERQDLPKKIEQRCRPSPIAHRSSSAAAHRHRCPRSTDKRGERHAPPRSATRIFRGAVRRRDRKILSTTQRSERNLASSGRELVETVVAGTVNCARTSSIGLYGQEERSSGSVYCCATRRARV